ncbi:MAG: ribonuclease D [Anaerolineales bacterium]|nr:ribonuclease D [Anaerolineales bacterium]
MQTPTLVEDIHELHDLESNLLSQPRFAVDTESNSLHAYQEQVCLIQISIPGSDYLVDPLRLTNLDPIRSLMADSNIEKVFHAAEYDIICLKRDFGFQIANLFDTRVALRTLGRIRTGLGDVLHEEFGVHLNKRLQRANWGQRPLPRELLDYAALDTHYLLPLRDLIVKELVEARRWEEATEECKRISHIEPSANDLDEDRFWRVSGARRLSHTQTAILRELFILREEEARRLDRPTFKVFGDKVLIGISQSEPRDLDELGQLPGMTAKQINRFGTKLIAAVERGRVADPPTRPVNERLDDAVLNRYKRLRTWRKRMAEARQVESDIILPRELVMEIAREAPQSREELREIMQPLEWRFQTYADEILERIQS